MLTDDPWSGVFIPISAGVFPFALAIGLVISVSMKPGVQEFTVSFGYSLAKQIVYAFVQALENPYAFPIIEFSKLSFPNYKERFLYSFNKLSISFHLTLGLVSSFFISWLLLARYEGPDAEVTLTTLPILGSISLRNSSQTRFVP